MCVNIERQIVVDNQIIIDHRIDLYQYLCLCFEIMLRLTNLRGKFLKSKQDKRKPSHEKVDVAQFLESKESTFSEMYREMTWYSLEKIVEIKLGNKHRLRTLKQKRDWCLSQNWELVTNAQGQEGVAFAAEDEGIMKMKVGNRFSADKVKRETFDAADDLDTALEKAKSKLEVAPASKAEFDKNLDESDDSSSSSSSSPEAVSISPCF